MSTLQQVNLYVPELRPQKQTFTFRTMLATWGLVLAFFASLQSWGWYQIRHTQDQLAYLEQRQQQVLQQLDGMRGSKQGNKNAELEANINRLQIELDRRRRILQILEDRKLGNDNGFSGYLLGLSHQAMNGLSLEYIGLSEGGKHVELSGWTYRAESVPGYVQRLRNEDSFRHATFGDLSIERDSEVRSDALRFRLGKAEEGGS